jgi:hypothetical protein
MGPGVGSGAMQPATQIAILLSASALGVDAVASHMFPRQRGIILGVGAALAVGIVCGSLRLIPGETVGDAFVILAALGAVYLWLYGAHRYRKQTTDRLATSDAAIGKLRTEIPFAQIQDDQRQIVEIQNKILRRLGALESQPPAPVATQKYVDDRTGELRTLLGGLGDSIGNNATAIEDLRGPLQITEKGAAKRIDIYFNHKSLTEVNYAIAVLVGEIDRSISDLRGGELSGPGQDGFDVVNRGSTYIDPKYPNIRDLSDAVERLEERGRGPMDRMFNRQKP